MIKAIDFFSGAGGLTRGLLDADIDVVAGVDNDTRLRDTYQCNNKPSRFIKQDVVDVNIKALRRKVGIRSADTTLYAACTPFQPFSTLNPTKGDNGQKALLLKFAAIIAESPPDFVIVENVPGLNNAIGRDIYRQFEAVLAEHGFSSDAHLAGRQALRRAADAQALHSHRLAIWPCQPAGTHHRRPAANG